MNSPEMHLSYFEGSPFGFLLFKRNLQNRTELKGPPIDFFPHSETFFRNFYCHQRVPLSGCLLFCSKVKFQSAQRIPLLCVLAL